MKIKMLSSVGLMCAVALLVMDSLTDAYINVPIALPPHQCYECKDPGCQQRKVVDMGSILCPEKKPFCATRGQSPDFRSELGCSDSTQSDFCQMYLTPENIYQINCLCMGDLCNAPFSEMMRNRLIGLTRETNARNVSKFLHAVQKVIFSPENLMNLYNYSLKAAHPTGMAMSYSRFPPTNKHDSELALDPHVEALKQQTTVPSDDEEDEVEGSGTYDEQRTNLAPEPPSAPSSLLPAEESAAGPPLVFNALAAIPIIYHIVG